MKTRIIHTKIWNDATFVDLSKNGKVLFLYLISNEYVGLTGAYEISNRTICFNTGLTLEELLESKKELDKPFIFDGDWVLIRNQTKYNNYTANEFLKKAYIKEFDLIPKHLQKFLQKIYLKNDTSVLTSMALVSNGPNTNIVTSLNKKQEIINHKLEIINNNNSGVTKTFDELKKEIGKPMTGISTVWQDDAFRHADYLGIDLKKNPDLKSRWLGFYKRSYGQAVYGRVQQALTFLKDYQPYIRIATARGRMLYFFDVVQNYEKYHSERR